MSNFLKEHIFGVFITSVAASLLAAWLLQVFPFYNSEKEEVSGVIVLNNFGEYTEKYGVRFDSAPKLGFFNEYGAVYTGGAIEVLQHENDGFKYKIDHGFHVGRTVTWVATGTVKDN